MSNIIFLAAAATAATAQPQTKTIRLELNGFDTVAQIQVMSGRNAPHYGPVSTFRSIKKGWSATYRERVCYRRTRDAGDAASGLTDWRCSTDGDAAFQQLTIY